MDILLFVLASVGCVAVAWVVTLFCIYVVRVVTVADPEERVQFNNSVVGKAHLLGSLVLGIWMAWHWVMG